jgi:aspartate kinase
MKVVVQKFGGTCVEAANQESTVERILEVKDAGMYPVAVVSAMGREEPPSTPWLVDLAWRIDPKVEPRELDQLMSCGEIISAVRVAHLLKSKGYDTVALSGGQAGVITDDYHNHADIIELHPERVLAYLDEKRIVCVAGFQGITRDHAITTLGEGGTDYTAVALASVLHTRRPNPIAEEIEVAALRIYKEVEGVMTANPDHFGDKRAKRTLAEPPINIPGLTFNEMVSMSELGANVIQAKAARMARDHRQAMEICDFRGSQGTVTYVGEEVKRGHQREVTGVADMKELFVFTVPGGDRRLGQKLSEHLVHDRLHHYVLPTEDGGFRFAVKTEKYRQVDRIVGETLHYWNIEAEFSQG